MNKPNREPGDEADDVRARFPDPDADERLQTPRGGALPEVPKTEFHRPTLPQADPLAKYPKMKNLPEELQGAGAASTIGLNLVVSIVIGTGLGWLADRYLLGGPATPWGLIIGFLLGTVSGFVNVVRVANRLNKDR